jgi:hypothetical protein
MASPQIGDNTPVKAGHIIPASGRHPSSELVAEKSR